MSTPISSDNEWEKISISEGLNSSSSDEEAPDSGNDEWCIIKSARTKIEATQPILKEDSTDEEEADAGGIILGLYDDDYNKEGRITELMLEMLFEHFPELQNEENTFLLEYIEQNRFPYLGTEALSCLKLACLRWERWISSDFFVHMQSILHREISGVFYRNSDSDTAFSSFDNRLVSKDVSLFAYLPEHVLVRSSTYGLVVCRGKVSGNYYVCNPATAKWTMLPETKNVHGDDTEVVIVLKEPLTFNFNKDYYVVCAYEIFEGVYGFETFSSENWTWNLCNEIIAAEKVVPSSGVGVNGMAYWKTTMQQIVSFNPDLNVWEEMVWNNGKYGYGDWTIGELGKKLCVVNMEYQHVCVWTLENGEWTRTSIKREKFSTLDNLKPLSTQGEKEVIIWDWGKNFIIALDIENWNESELVDFNPLCRVDFVPYISTFVHVSGSQRYISPTSSLAAESDSEVKGIVSHEQQKGK